MAQSYDVQRLARATSATPGGGGRNRYSSARPLMKLSLNPRVCSVVLEEEDEPAELRDLSLPRPPPADGAERTKSEELTDDGGGRHSHAKHRVSLSLPPDHNMNGHVIPPEKHVISSDDHVVPQDGVDQPIEMAEIPAIIDTSTIAKSKIFGERRRSRWSLNYLRVSNKHGVYTMVLETFHRHLFCHIATS